MTDLIKLKKALPEFTIADLKYGANIYMSDRVITCYWKKRKYGDNKTSIWANFDSVEHLIGIIENLSVKPVKVQKIDDPINNAVQKCIDHINKKAEIASKIKGADNSVVVILKTIAQELVQYL